MIHYLEKDISDVESGIIVHGVNCQGKMGAGVALALRKKYPEIYEPYYEMCRKNFAKPSALLGQNLAMRIHESREGLFIVNAFTQEYYGRDGRRYVSYDAVDKCFRDIEGWLKINDAIEVKLNVYIPKIGCNLGGGDWSVISSIIETQLKDRDVYCCIKQQTGQQPQRQTTDTKKSHLQSL